MERGEEEKAKKNKKKELVILVNNERENMEGREREREGGRSIECY